MLEKIEDIKTILGIDITDKSKVLKHRYLRLCFYTEFKAEDPTDIKLALKVTITDVRRYVKQIESVVDTELYYQTSLAYANMDLHHLTNIFNSDLRAYTPRGNYPTEATETKIPYSIMDVIDIMKPHRDFSNPLWDKDLKSYTTEDWEEIELLKDC